MLDCTYMQSEGAVVVRAFEVNLPSSRMSAQGKLGAWPLTSPTCAECGFSIERSARV